MNCLYSNAIIKRINFLIRRKKPMKAEVPTAHKSHSMALSSSSFHAFCPLYKFRGPASAFP